MSLKSGMITKVKMPSIHPFDFQIKYTETNRRTHEYEINLHTHSEFELYINLAGNVSFLVEDSLYPLSRGDVIIARPGEAHHCVYRDDTPHKLFWILFDCKKNAQFWDFLQESFCDNFISPKKDLREELIALCCSLHNGARTQEESLYALLRIFEILKKSRSTLTAKRAEMPRELNEIMAYINDHISEEITVTDIAKTFYISKSTLERRFKDTLAMRPSEFIKRKKLIYAAELLKNGESVLNAGTSVGYKDNSYFIELFKQYYSMTPYQYKKKISK